MDRLEVQQLDWMGSREAAALIGGVSQRTVTQWADAGELPCLRTPGGHRRFRRRDVEAFIEARTHAGAAS